MKAKTECIVCGNQGKPIVRNDVSMLLCDKCGLYWRESFDLPCNFYDTREFELEKAGKEEARYANSLERIKTFQKYTNMNNLCDVGCGEGIFLKTLCDLGYKNSVGLEPSVEAREFATQNNLKIIQGGVENINKAFLNENRIHTLTLFHVIEHLSE